MKNQLARRIMVRASVFALVISCLVSPAVLAAQGTAGQNAICPTSSGCAVPAGSSAFIDAAAFSGTNTNFCAVLNFVLASNVPSVGAVIDTRGLPATGTSMTCAASPWGSGSSYLNIPSTILLPATVITIPRHWILPNGTALIGENNRSPIGVNGGVSDATTAQM